MTTKLNPGKPDGGETPAICPTCQSSDPIRRGQLHWNLIPSGWCRDAWHAPSPQPSAEATHLQITPELVKALSMETQFPGGVIMEPAPSGETRGTCPHSAISHSFEFCREHHFILERMWKPLAPEAAKKVDWRQEAPIIHAQFVNGKWPLFGTEDIRFLALGIAGEAGEIANDVKKEWRGDPPNRVNLKKELADVRIYLELLAIALDCNLDETCREKLEEVKQRLSAAPEATTKEPEFHVIGMDFAKPDGDRTGYRCSTCGVTTEPCRHLQLLIAKGEVAPGEAVGRGTRELHRNDVVGQVLQEFGFRSAAALRTVIVDMRMAESTLRRERDQLKETLDLAVEDTNELDKEVARLESQVRELTADREYFKTGAERQMEFAGKLKLENVELRAAVEKLEGLLKKFGEHAELCTIGISDGVSPIYCNCGWCEVLAAIK